MDGSDSQCSEPFKYKLLITEKGVVIRMNTNKLNIIKKDLKLNRTIYLLAIPMIVYYILFSYIPMYGVVIAFQNYKPTLGISGSEWVGFEHFKSFFNNHFFWRLIRNTLMLSLYNLVFSFPAPILLALLLNEIHHNSYKRIVQTVSYIPHFISLVVICGMIKDFTSVDGIFNDIAAFLGVQRVNMLQEPGMFRLIYTASDIWSGIGWGSIIYLSALTSIDQELYEAAKIDGAGRFKQVLHVTLPGIASTVIIMFILRIGSIMSVGADKVLLLYNSSTYETADIISTYVYRLGIAGGKFSYTTAVGLFNTVINLILVVSANKVSRTFSEYSLW